MVSLLVTFENQSLQFYAKNTYKVLPFGLCNVPTTFQRLVLAIFYDYIHDCVEVYINDFTVYGNTFEESLDNSQNVLIIFQEANLPPSNEHYFLIFTKGIVLVHHVSFAGIKVYPSKIEVILNLPIPSTQKDVRIFLGHQGYCMQFIGNFTKIPFPLFKQLSKDVDFYWDINCQTAFNTLKEKISTTPI